MLSLELILFQQPERNWLIRQLQELAQLHQIRISFLSGDVSCAAVGFFKTHAKDKVSQKTDYRYMVNVVTSKFWRLKLLVARGFNNFPLMLLLFQGAIVNSPP